MMFRIMVIARAKDAVRKSHALACFWQRPLTSEQIQMEMGRMAQHSKQEDVFCREIWSALNNDLYMIAKCLMRWVLADRLLLNWHAYDERFHSELKKSIKKEIASLEWSEDSFEEWWQKVSETMPVEAEETKGHYSLPKLDDTCALDTWEDIAGTAGAA